MTYTDKDDTGNVAQFKGVVVSTNDTAPTEQFQAKFILSNKEEEYWRSIEGKVEAVVEIYLPDL